MSHEEEEPASPGARLMQAPSFNLCILAVMGYMTTIDLNLFKEEIGRTLAKHPRFSSLLVLILVFPRDFQFLGFGSGNGEPVIAPDLDPEMENPDKFIDDYISGLSKNQMPSEKPLWEVHVLNVRNSDANSTIVFKIDHSIGDGVSLISLVLACARKNPDPESLPVVRPKKHKKTTNNGLMIKRLFVLVWTLLTVMFNTLVDCILFVATIMFLKDTKTPIKAEREVELSPRRFVRRIISLEDVKFIKNAMNVSINDVVLGVTEAGLSRYLNTTYDRICLLNILGYLDIRNIRYPIPVSEISNTRISKISDTDIGYQNLISENFGYPKVRISDYEHPYKKHNENGAEIMKKSTNHLPKNLRIRSACVFNLRPCAKIQDLAEMMAKEKLVKGMWGNLVGIVVLPLTIDLSDDPLIYIRRAKAIMDKKKLSLGHKFTFGAMKLMLMIFGNKIAAGVSTRVFRNTTLTFSNVVGPQEEINVFGHPLAYIAPSVFGFPQGLVIHYQSYADKLVIAMSADEKLIPNPHQLCDDLVKSFENIKEAVIKRGIVKGSELC
ncbi:hypothetical protein OROHE_021870 [Orobanche hederae]